MAHENGSMKYDIDISKQDQSTSHGKILAQIKPGSKVLECGCATGYMTQRMKEELGCKVSIIEIDEACYECAKEFAVDGFCGDLNQEEWFEHFSNQQFDYILFADVLEHLPDPLKVLTRMTVLLKSNGRIIISIPNIAHNDIIMKLVGDRFDYTSTGLLDNTHIHFWGRNNLDDFCQKAGLTIVQIDGTIAPFKTTEQAADNHETSDSRIISGLTDRTLGEIYQYVLVTQKTEYVKKHRIKCVNLLPQEKSFSGYQTGKDVSVCSTVFFSDGETFEQSNSQETVFTLNTAFSREIELIVTPPENCRTIRFDPCEAFFCLVENLSFVYDGMAISPQNTNGLPVGTAYLFSTRDPQLYFSIPRLKKDTSIVIRCKLTIFDETKEKEVAEFVKRFEDMGVLIHQVEQLNNELNIAQSELKLAQETKKELACCTVYFADEAGFHEENKATFNQPISRDDNSTFSLNFDVKVPIGCTKVRIDPCEGKYCVASSIRLIYAGRRLTGSPADGFVVGDTVFFRNEDPQLIVDLPDGNGMVLHADMTMRLFDVRDLTIESVDQRIREDSEKISTLSEDISKLKETHVREIAAMQESQEAKLAELEQGHAQEIAALQESQQTKLSELEQGHVQEILALQEKQETQLTKLQQLHEKEIANIQFENQRRDEKLNSQFVQKISSLEETLDKANQQRNLLEKDNADKSNYIGEVVTLCNDRLTQIEALTAQVNSLQTVNRELSARCTYAEQSYATVSNAFFWKITKPGRAVMDGVKKIAGKNEHLDLGLKTVKWTLRYGPKEAGSRRKQYKAERSRRLAAATWPSEEELAKQREEKFPKDIKFSVLVPLYNTPERFLREMIESVQNQSYQNWELCLADGSDAEHADVGVISKKYARKDKRIKYKKLEKNMGISGNTNACIDMATGDYIALFDHDDILHPSALYEVMKAICEKDADFIYTDENTFHDTPKDAYSPNFKPDFAPDTLRSYNYICHLSVFKESLLKKAGGGFRAEFDGSQDYDMVLRLTEKAQHIVHIPKILYYWRSHEQSVASNISAKPYTLDAAKKALTEHLKRVHLEGTVSDSRIPSTYHIQYLIKGNPKVSIIIPNKDHVDDLAKCVNSIIEQSTWKNWEIIIVENNSSEAQTFQYYKQLTAKEKRIRVITWKKEFNYSAICNFGAKEAKGQYLLMLNNDIEVITPNWLEEMLMFAQRKDVGAVGAMLYYPDETVQHGGVILGIGGIAGHAHKYFNRGDYGYMSRLSIAQNLSAVTAACALIRKSVWDEVKGLDEGFAVAFNDVDLCMKIRKAGYLIVWTPYAELYHYESKSRGLEDTVEKQKRFAGEISRFKKKWGKELEAGDPYYNPNLTLDREDFGIKKRQLSL